MHFYHERTTSTSTNSSSSSSHEVSGTCWNLLWTWSKPRINYSSLLVFQRVNHIVNSRQLTRKDLLHRHVDRYVTLSNLERVAGADPASYAAATASGEQQQEQQQQQHQDFFNILPQTFSLPQNYTEFVAAYTQQHQQQMKKTRQCLSSPSHSNSRHTDDDKKAEDGNHNVWIMKPIDSSRGRGIKLIQDLTQVVYSEAVGGEKKSNDRYIDMRPIADRYVYK